MKLLSKQNSALKKKKNDKVTPITMSKGVKNNGKLKRSQRLSSIISVDGVSDGIIRLKKKGKPVMAGVLAITGMDIYNMQSYERDSVFYNMARATLSLRSNHKYIFTSKTPYLASQKAFVKHKTARAVNKYAQSLLSEQLSLFDSFENNHFDRMAYLFIYDTNEKKIRDAAKRYMSQMTDINVSWCSEEEIIETMNKLLTLNTATEKLSQSGDPDLRLLPDEVEFAPNYYKIGDKYAQTIVVYDYAAQLDDLTYTDIVTGYADTIIWDIQECEKRKVISDLEASLKELESRSGITQDRADVINTATELEKLQQIYIDIKNGNEQIYYVTLRFLVADNDLQRLKERTLDIVNELEQSGLSAFIPTNLTQEEYLSVPFEGNRIKTPFPVYDTLARQFPFYYQSHIDKHGLFFGYTATGGLNILNTFTRTQERNSYDLLAVGVKGGGKSVTLKSMLEEQILLGNKVMVLDIESEYHAMAKVYDGQIIKMNQRSRINPLQITTSVSYKVEEDISAEDNARANYASELSRIRTFMSMYIPQIDVYTLEIFMDLVTECLSDCGIFPDTDVSFLSPDSFPTFTDVVGKIRLKLEKGRGYISQKLIDAYSDLEVYLKQLSGDGAYANMFDGATNVDIQNNNLIVFDVKTISEMSENVYNAQLFNILTIMWATVCRNVDHNQFLVNPLDRRNVVCLIDEAHRFISVKYPQVTEFIEKLVRRTRKYDAGLWFATQSILDFIPNGDTAAAEQIKVIFSLVQYKILLKQAPESIETLHKIFPQFTVAELNASVQFIPGQMLLSLGAGRNKLHCRRLASPKQLLYMGNAQDRIEIIHECFEHYYNEHTTEEYALMLKNVDLSYFRSCFMGETYSYLGLDQGDSQYLDNTVILLVDNLIKELLSYAAATVKEGEA